MNYYERLCINNKASEEDIIISFRKLAKKYHPDINKSANAKNDFIEIFEAYSILKDSTKRKIYDSILTEKDEPKEEPTTENNNYQEWKQRAHEAGTHYSENDYTIFNDEVLRRLKEVGKFSKKVLSYFGLLIVIGVVSKFIISPVLTEVIQTSIQDNIQLTQDEQVLLSQTGELEKSKSLPIPNAPLLDGWKRIYIENIGTLDLPPTMEVQSGIYKEIIDPLKPTIMKTMGVASNTNYDIVIQQKGLNDLNKESFNKYARVMVNTDVGNDGDFDDLTFDISQFSLADIIQLDSVVKSGVEQSFEGTAIKLNEWFPLRLEIINGMSCIHISYERQLNNNPSVIVDLYKFQNINAMYTITLSYRKNEREYWIEYLPKMLSSFRIENINYK